MTAAAVHGSVLTRVRYAWAVALGRVSQEEPVIAPLPPRRRPAMAWWRVVTLALVSAMVVVICSTAWAQLAGRPVVLREVVKQVSLGQIDLERELEVSRVRATPPSLEDPTQNVLRRVQPSRAAKPAARGEKGPTTMNGTLLATMLSAIAITLGAVIQRHIHRHIHRRLDKAPPTPSDPREDDDIVVKEETASPRWPALTDQPTTAPADVIERADDTSSAPVDDEDRADSEDRADHPGAQDPGGSQETLGFRTPASSATESVHPRVVLYDRRANGRRAFESRARLQWDDNDIGCRTESLDIFGVRCSLPDTTPPVPVGTPVLITMALDGGLLSIDTRANWTRLEGERILVGLHFDPLSDAHRAALLAFVGEATDADVAG